jgi:hypothetical protein
VFGGFGLRIDRHQAQKRLLLNPAGAADGVPPDSLPYHSLPFMVWSAGQREFVPLLLGFYWLLPPTKVPRRANLRWVVIEEIEMGLHPKAISAVLLLVMDLLARDYRVCLSTHSPHVLDAVWALRTIQKHGAPARRLLELFEAKATPNMKELAERVLTKKAKVYFFDRATGGTRDISDLDPGAQDQAEAGWGGLTDFSGRVADIVASVVSHGGD